MEDIALTQKIDILEIMRVLPHRYPFLMVDRITSLIPSKRVTGIDPLKIIIDNYPEGQVEELEARNHPQKPELGTRTVPFSRELYIERADFMEDRSSHFCAFCCSIYSSLGLSPLLS